MKSPLPTFHMEDWLEKYRFTARFNAGESGHRPQSLSSFLNGLQVDFDFDLRRALEDVSLCDAPNMGFADLREEVARLHPGATIDNVLITTGTSEALLLLLRQLKPRRVAVITPAFQLLTEIPRSLGAQVVPLPLVWSEAGQPRANLERWLEVLEEQKPDVFIFNHPHNPSGLTFSDQEKHQLCELCDAIGCTIVADEHYRFLIDQTGFNSCRIEIGQTLWTKVKRRFVTGSFIKCAGTPGLRIGWCVGETPVLDAMQSEKNYLTHTVNPVSQKLALWFLQSFHREQSFFAPLHNEWLQNKVLLHDWLNESTDWTGCVPEGGLVSCLFPRTLNSIEGTFEALKAQGIFLLPLSSFCETFMDVSAFTRGFRLGLGLSPKEFKTMLSVMGGN